MKELSTSEIAEIVLAEYKYWRDASERDVSDESPEITDIQMGAIGAAANIYAAILGQRAPWHPQKAPVLPVSSNDGEAKIENQ